MSPSLTDRLDRPNWTGFLLLSEAIGALLRLLLQLRKLLKAHVVLIIHLQSHRTSKPQHHGDHHNTPLGQKAFLLEGSKLTTLSA